jgi:hypothetical protein
MKTAPVENWREIPDETFCRFVDGIAVALQSAPGFA